MPLLLVALAASVSHAQPAADQIPPQMVVVKPISRSTAAPTPRDLEIIRGRYFSYALPQGWRVGEEGQFALTLIAPDRHAFTLMVGNAGMLPNYPLDRFVREKLAAIRPQNLRLSAGRQVVPRAGFHHAAEFDVAYTSQLGIPSRGVVKCNVARSYDTALIVMIGAFSVESQWSDYASWLPLSAEQIAATDGAAFGRRGIMAQNLQLSKEYGEATRAYREWSQQNWQQVTAQRQAAEGRKNYYERENLGSSKAYTNPYDSSVSVDLPQAYKYYWANRQGTYVGTNDPSVNPNDGSTGEWKPLPLQRP
jgi:hypothetical protein